ncbi:MAG TPA: hypothetical protein VKM93_25280 [Terriglobia bacterium]|nr:hypothetical protein [Terriglobia bacterium]
MNLFEGYVELLHHFANRHAGVKVIEDDRLPALAGVAAASCLAKWRL